MSREHLVPTETTYVPVFDERVNQITHLAVEAIRYGNRLIMTRAGLIGALGLEGYMNDGGLAKPEIEFPCGLAIHTEQRLVTVNNVPIPQNLTSLEFTLLRRIAAEPMRVHPRKELKSHIWGPDYYGDEHVVDVHVSNTRRKLNAAKSVPINNNVTNYGLIETIWGVGFKMGARAFEERPLILPGM